MIETIKEILERKDLLRELTLKELKMRYARLGLGFLWAILSPLLTVATLYFIFSFILKIKTDEAPFALYLMSAVFPWLALQNSVNGSCDSLVANKNLLRESQIPQYFIPLSKVLAEAVNFLPALLIVIIISFAVMKGPSNFLLFLPIVMITHLILTFGLALLFSMAYLYFRDIKYILEHVFTILFYLTPVFYSIYLVKDNLPKALFWLYMYNPFVGLLLFYRVAIIKGYYSYIYKDAGAGVLFFLPVIFSFLVLYFALKVYSRMKYKINDHLSY